MKYCKNKEAGQFFVDKQKQNVYNINNEFIFRTQKVFKGPDPSLWNLKDVNSKIANMTLLSLKSGKIDSEFVTM